MFLKDVSEQLLLKDDFDPAVLKDDFDKTVPTPDDFEEGAPSGVFGEGLPSLQAGSKDDPDPSTSPKALVPDSDSEPSPRRKWRTRKVVVDYLVITLPFDLEIVISLHLVIKPTFAHPKDKEE